MMVELSAVTVRHKSRTNDWRVGCVALQRAGAHPGSGDTTLTGQGSRERRHGDGDLPLPAIADWVGDGRPVTIAIVALASFEIINAAYGRQVGDALVRAAATRIERAIANTSLAATEWVRDGSVFTLATPAAMKDAHPLVTAIEFALAQPFVVGTTTVHVGTRIGVASGADELADALVVGRRLLAEFGWGDERCVRASLFRSASCSALRLRIDLSRRSFRYRWRGLDGHKRGELTLPSA